MGVKDKIREAVRNFLNIDTPKGLSINIEQLFSHDAEVFRNTIWYRGMANELEAFYSSVNDGIGDTHFWGSKPTKGMNIRKIHTGLPSLIVDVLTDICTDDVFSIKVDGRQKLWDEIAEKNNFDDLLSNAVREMLYKGDGAFKLSYDKEISEYPIIEFYGADRVDYKRNRGIISCIDFKTEKIIKNRHYTLIEHYTTDGVSYSLVDQDGKEYDTKNFEEFENLPDVQNKGKFFLAVPMFFRSSAVYKGRGKSIFSGKYDNFDSFDEIFSQWMLAIRKGQMKTYIPEMFLPVNPYTGETLAGSDFDNDYIKLQNDMKEGEGNKITTTQGTIQSNALLSAYCTALDLCLHGIISPSTLGIDTKKLDNAESQREKEKTTLYTRNKVLDILNDAIPKLVKTTLMFYDNLHKVNYEDCEITVNCGGYANPSFEAQVETIGKAATAEIMSIETQVEELYGDTKNADWKKEEVNRIKIEKGILEVEEPAVNNDI